MNNAEDVAVVQCENYDPPRVFKKVSESLSLLGDLDLAPGKRVLIKPNILGPFPPEKAVTTHPELINSVIKFCKKRGLEVCLGESSGFGAKGGTKRALQKSGIAEVCEREEIKFIDFDSEERVNVDLKGTFSGILNHISVPRAVIEADYVISIPKLKTHGLTGYTGAIKNMFGTIPGKTKSALHHHGRTVENFSKILVDIYQALPASLTVMDAIVGMEGRGPTHGKPRELGLILSSQNGAALDYVAAQTIGYDPLEIDMIKIAKERGLFREPKVTGTQPDIVNFRKPNILGLGTFGWISKFVRPNFRVNPDVCQRCYQCIDRCPENAINIDENKLPKWNIDACISCYCCEELCPADAVIAKRTGLGRVINLFTGRYND